MATVGVRELRARLSHYLRRIKQGERIVVTDHGEPRAAFARRSREGVLSAQGYRAILQQFNAEWGRYLHLDVTDAIIMASGDIAEKYHLRAYDAIHLTSAIVLKNRLS